MIKRLVAVSALSFFLITPIQIIYANSQNKNKNEDASFFFGLFNSDDQDDVTNVAVKVDDTTYIDFNSGTAKPEAIPSEELRFESLSDSQSDSQSEYQSQSQDSLVSEDPYVVSEQVKKIETKKANIVNSREHKTKFGKHDPFYGKHLCGNGEYSCIKIKKSDTWKSLFPNDYERELVQRLNRTNGGLWNRSWLLVPNTFSNDYLKYSPLPAHRPDITEKTIVVDQKELAFGAYNAKGELVHWGPVNPGKAGTKTALGSNFKVYRKGGANCWSKKFDASIPYCIFFNGGYALHGFHMPGYPASHGCVRMNNSDAKWLNKEFTDYKTKVIVKDIRG